MFVNSYIFLLLFKKNFTIFLGNFGTERHFLDGFVSPTVLPALQNGARPAMFRRESSYSSTCDEAQVAIILSKKILTKKNVDKKILTQMFCHFTHAKCALRSAHTIVSFIFSKKVFSSIVLNSSSPPKMKKLHEYS